MEHVNIRLVSNKRIATLTYKILNKVEISEKSSEMNRSKTVYAFALTVNPSY